MKEPNLRPAAVMGRSPAVWYNSMKLEGAFSACKERVFFAVVCDAPDEL